MKPNQPLSAVSRVRHLFLLPLLAALAAGPFVACGDAGAPAYQSISAEALSTRIEAGNAPFVLDVRSSDEFASGHVPGAVNIPYDQLSARLAEIPAPGETVVLYCRSGRRADVAAKVLLQAGHDDLKHLSGDMPGWIRDGYPVERGGR